MGQLAALGVMVPVVGVLFRYLVEPRVGGAVVSALVAHTAWHWMWERGAVLGRYSVSMAEWNAAMALKGVLVGMVLWAVWRWGRMRV